jgi:hypothetical protein
MIANIAPQSWLIHALTDSRSLGYLMVIIISAMLLLILVRAMRRLPAAPRHGGESGVATIEFALVLPIFLFLILLLTQTTLAMTGNLFVNYAAFAATRSAIVNIPSGNPNVVAPYPGEAKYDAVHVAAALACVPISGRGEEGSTPADAIVAGLTEHYQSYGRSAPVWIDRLIAPRVRYALANTDIAILRIVDITAYEVELEEVESTVRFGPREPITVRVEHRFALSIPYVWRIFSDDRDDRAVTLRAQYTLTNEGVVDALPPPPRLPRADTIAS